VGNLLSERRATVAVAESCTAGLVGGRLTAPPGSSDYFLGGFITYTNAMKTELLGVPADLLACAGAVSAETAEAMAVGARLRTGATYGVSVTGVAGPASGGENVPVGTVYVGIADSACVKATHRVFLGDRTRIRTFTAQMALDLLRRRLLN
jgi:nicotinamide-nucleotide amidase